MTEPVEDRGFPPFRDEAAKGWGTQVRFRIRRMRFEDIDLVRAIAESLNEAPRWGLEAYANAVDPAAAPARIALVAEDWDARVVGFAVTVLVPPQAELETIAVSLEFQRRGIARHLFSELLIQLKTLLITEVILEVRESNRAAQALYGSLGFVEEGRRRGYYTDPQEDAVLLRRLVFGGAEEEATGSESPGPE